VAGHEIVLYCSFSLMKKNQKIKAVFKSCDFATLSVGFAPKLAPPASGLKHGCSLPTPRAQNRDLNKAVHTTLANTLIFKFWHLFLGFAIQNKVVLMRLPWHSRWSETGTTR